MSTASRGSENTGLEERTARDILKQAAMGTFVGTTRGFLMYAGVSAEPGKYDFVTKADDGEAFDVYSAGMNESSKRGAIRVTSNGQYDPGTPRHALVSKWFPTKKT